MSVKLLDAATATGASGAWATHSGPSNHSVQVVITGAPTAVTVDLEISLDGSIWVSAASHVMSAGELTATQALFHVVDKPSWNVRVNVVTLTAGTAPTVTVVYMQAGSGS